MKHPPEEPQSDEQVAQVGATLNEKQAVDVFSPEGEEAGCDPQKGEEYADIEQGAIAEFEALRKQQAAQLERIKQAEATRYRDEQNPHQSEHKAEADQERARVKVESAFSKDNEQQPGLENRHLAKAETHARLAKEQQLKAEIEALRKTEADQLKRIEAAKAARLAHEGAGTQLTAEQVQLSEPAQTFHPAQEPFRVHAESEALRQAEERERQPAELETLRSQIEAEIQPRAELERQLRAGIAIMRKATARQLKRMEDVEVEAREWAEKEARLRSETETYLQAYAEVRWRAAEEEQRLNELEALRSNAEAQVLQRAEAEQQLRAGIEALRRALEKQNKRLEDARNQLSELEAEGRTLAEEEGRLQLAADNERQRIDEVEADLRGQGAHQARDRKDRRRSKRRFNVEEERNKEFSGNPMKVDRGDAKSDVEKEAGAVSDDGNQAVLEKSIDLAGAEKESERLGYEGSVISIIGERLERHDAAERVAALAELAKLGGDAAFRLITRSFDDLVEEVRNAAAQALYILNSDRADSFTTALRESSPERRRRIGAALASSGIAASAINNLAGESREKTYDAFSILFLMAKAGSVQPLLEAIQNHPNVSVRLAVIKLLSFSSRSEVVPALRRLAVRGSLPPEVRSAMMEAIHEINNQSQPTQRFG